ncbi:hypothetical protein [Streptomyces sp. SPB162]|uniref:hypothetical protein n=1 Tax=Streptomyces sp. SPB162 TaxID=2940560 RepID=UPI002405C4BF|nr:hypothetical protein [Streptomyces sp. SPB162]MDF9816426.1 hypothetical protein [Streptomyces sp. SPB162]
MPIWETEFDFGITGIASDFHQDWALGFADAGSLVAEYLAAEHGAPLVCALELDASSLARSTLPDSWLSDLWNASTDGYHSLSPGSSGGRAWMAEVADLAQQRLRQLHGPGEAEGHRTVQTADRRNLADVTRLIESLAPHLETSVGRYWRHIAVPRNLHTTLVECADVVSPELAFRFLHRILVAGSGGVDSEALATMRRLGRCFDYGEFMLSDIESMAR